MTNAEVAAHFAALPPDAPAEILLINWDTDCVAEHDVGVVSEITFDSDNENADDDEEKEDRSEYLGKLYIDQKW